MLWFYYVFNYVDTFYFVNPIKVVSEDDGVVIVNVSFSIPLRYDTFVQFRYDDLTAVGKLLT